MFASLLFFVQSKSHILLVNCCVVEVYNMQNCKMQKWKLADYAVCVCRRNIYFFFSVKKDFFLVSSFCWCDDAGNVCERLSLPDAVWHWAFSAATHCCNSASSCACNKYSLPLTNLRNRQNKMV